MAKKEMLPMDGFDSSSDDDAPDEVSVTSSRLETVAQLKRIQNANREKREEEKERRRQRNEMFHLQKQRKIQELGKRELPQDVLEGIPAKSSKITGNPKEEDKSGKDNSSEVSEDNEAGNNEAGIFGSNDEDEGFDETSADFIPLSKSSNLAVVTENQLDKMRLSSVQAAMNFKQSRLYNEKLIPRETTQQRRARVAKKRAYQTKR